MMKNNKTFIVIGAILSIVALVMNFAKLILLQLSLLSTVSTIAAVVALVFALLYALKGYRKTAAKDYKIYLAVIFFSTIVNFITDIWLTLENPIYNGSYVSTVCLFIDCVVLFLLLVSKNFGKTKSLIVVWIFTIERLFIVGRVLTIYSAVPSYIIGSICREVIAIITLLFVYEKYIDKAERGAK